MKRKQKLPGHIQKYLDEEKKKAELVEKAKNKQQTLPTTKLKAKRKTTTERSQVL